MMNWTGSTSPISLKVNLKEKEMFDQDSAVTDQPAGGSEVAAEQNAVVSVMQQTNTEEIASPSVESSADNLPWYLSMKYFRKQNRSGNGSHLAPQEVYVNDVLAEGDRVVLSASKDFMDAKSNDLKLAKDELAAAQSIIETRTAFDTSGVEAQNLLRMYLQRVILARKIAGASEVSAQHRVINATLTGQDVDKVKESDYFKSDLEARDKWAFKACYYEFLARELADGDIIKDLSAQIIAGVGRLLYDDSIQATNRLRNPQPVSPEARSDIDMDAIRAATA
jgi:hypothetical protein